VKIQKLKIKMQNYNSKLKILISLTLFYVFCFMFSVTIAKAAELYFKGPQEVKVGESFIIQAALNSDNELVNAIEGKIIFDFRKLELKDLSVGSSVIPFWMEGPELTDSGEVIFAGIMPGGFGADEGKIVDLIFKAKRSGRVLIFFEDYQVFLNEPELRQAEVKTKPFVLDIDRASQGTDLMEGKTLVLDFYPPEPFKIYIAKSKELFDDEYVAIFSAQDKESGVDYYEIKELFLGFSGNWQVAESPYPLQYQSLFSIIKVRAVDKVGRERIETVVPKQLVYLIAVVLIGFVFEYHLSESGWLAEIISGDTIVDTVGGMTRGAACAGGAVPTPML